MIDASTAFAVVILVAPTLIIMEAMRQLVSGWLKSRGYPETDITEITLVETSRLPISGSLAASAWGQ